MKKHLLQVIPTTKKFFHRDEIKAFLRDKNFPEHFEQWNAVIFDCYKDIGYTVAHLAAERDSLPKNFTQWMIKDRMGRTVLHVAHHRIQKRFDLMAVRSA